MAVRGSFAILCKKCHFNYTYSKKMEVYNDEDMMSIMFIVTYATNFAIKRFYNNPLKSQTHI